MKDIDFVKSLAADLFIKLWNDLFSGWYQISYEEDEEDEE